MSTDTPTQGELLSEAQNYADKLEAFIESQDLWDAFESWEEENGDAEV